MNLPENNKSLRPALLAWQVAPPVDPGFRSSVWAAIEAVRDRASATWAGYLRRHLVAWALVFGLVMVGAVALGLSAGAKHSAIDREMVLASYVAAIDARAMEP